MAHCSYATEQEQECLTGIILHLFLAQRGVCVALHRSVAFAAAWNAEGRVKHPSSSWITVLTDDTPCLDGSYLMPPTAVKFRPICVCYARTSKSLASTPPPPPPLQIPVEMRQTWYLIYSNCWWIVFVSPISSLYCLKNEDLVQVVDLATTDCFSQGLYFSPLMLKPPNEWCDKTQSMSRYVCEFKSRLNTSEKDGENRVIQHLV